MKESKDSNQSKTSMTTRDAVALDARDSELSEAVPGTPKMSAGIRTAP